MAHELYPTTAGLSLVTILQLSRSNSQRFGDSHHGHGALVHRVSPACADARFLGWLRSICSLHGLLFSLGFQIDHFDILDILWRYWRRAWSWSHKLVCSSFPMQFWEREGRNLNHPCLALHWDSSGGSFSGFAQEYNTAWFSMLLIWALKTLVINNKKHLIGNCCQIASDIAAIRHRSD